jgi:Large polyvalent protein associated domain 23
MPFSSNLAPQSALGSPDQSYVQPVMFGGEGAVGAPVAQLKQAQEMQTGGATPENIYAKTQTPETTGWFQGPEGAWRFEFSDTGAQFNPETLTKMHAGEQVQLNNLVSHPQLFQYYPHLKDVKLQGLTQAEEDSGLRGSYDPTSNTLKLLKDPEQARSTLMHELQHMIQNKENWAKGGDASSPTQQAKVDSGFNTINTLDKAIDERRQIETAFEPRLKAALAGPREEFDKILAERKAAWDAAWKKYEDADKRDAALANKADAFKRSFSDYESYRRLGGETEARNTQARLLMDLAARQQSMPTTTQEYPYEGQLVVTPRPR